MTAPRANPADPGPARAAVAPTQRARRGRGFTLIELAVVATAAATLLAIGWPSLQDHLARARRADATFALERIQFAQERHHALHGLYATSLQPLGSQALSLEGLYEVSMTVGPGDRYTAVARARAGAAQARDADCPAITLSVEMGFATLGPSRQCWNR
jgi:prepilin-type N-terminal cleavage/methylation domain-containing protein